MALNNDKFYRSVPAPEKRPDWWEISGGISHAVFLDDRGVSVDKGCGRDLISIVEYMKAKRKLCCDYVFTITLEDCLQDNIFIHNTSDKYHYALYRSENELCRLTPTQARNLRNKAKCEYNDDRYPPYSYYLSLSQ